MEFFDEYITTLLIYKMRKVKTLDQRTIRTFIELKCLLQNHKLQQFQVEQNELKLIQNNFVPSFQLKKYKIYIMVQKFPIPLYFITVLVSAEVPIKVCTHFPTFSTELSLVIQDYGYSGEIRGGGGIETYGILSKIKCVLCKFSKL